MTGAPTYDRFRNRLTIPILDAKSRVIAFGARALDPDAEPKYLNSPETQALRQRLDRSSISRARAKPLSTGASWSWSKAIWT